MDTTFSEMISPKKIDIKKFKELKEKTSVAFGDITVKVKSIGFSSEWVFDAYGDEWHYRKAERGDKYLVAKFSISSKVKDPLLPAVSVYKVIDGNIELVGQLEYKFSRWKDFGTYLGNYADYGNDFAQTETISFSNGLSIPESDFKGIPIIVVIHHNGCYMRYVERFDTPPVTYSESNSCEVPKFINLSEAGKSYTVIKVFNRDKL